MNEAKQMVRLGEGAFATHELQPKAMERTMVSLCSFADMCRGYGVEEYIAVATAASRDADNGEEFLEGVRERTGIDFEITLISVAAPRKWRQPPPTTQKSWTV